MSINVEMNETTGRTYLPAAGHDWMLPLYDPLVRLLGADRARRTLLDQAAIRAGQRVLDVGCGTGRLLVLMKRRHPNVEAVGLDPDPKALARTRHKAERIAVSIQLDRGFADELPYGATSFDRVFSSFMFHHLEGDEKEKMLREIRGVLKPGGSLHLLDFGGPESGAHSWFARRLRSSRRLRDNSEARILALMRQAGFTEPEAVSRGAMFFGQIAYVCYRASAPAAVQATGPDGVGRDEAVRPEGVAESVAAGTQESITEAA